MVLNSQVWVLGFSGLNDSSLCCPESDSPTEYSPNSRAGPPLCLWSSSKSPSPRAQSPPSPSITHAQPSWEAVRDLEIGVGTGHTKRWAAGSVGLAKRGHHTWPPQGKGRRGAPTLLPWPSLRAAPSTLLVGDYCPSDSLKSYTDN